MDLRPSWESQLPVVVTLPDGSAVVVDRIRGAHGAVLHDVDHVALIASLGDKPVAVARMIAFAGDAELAFFVKWEHQRRGIGSILRDELVAIAQARGLRRLHAHVLPDNVAIRRLLATPSFDLVGDRGHVLELVLAAQ